MTKRGGSIRTGAWAALAVAATVASTGCSAHDAPAAPGENQAPIEGGEIDTADPAVGLLVYKDGNSCTGSLIAPTVVLTAGHCVVHALDGFYTQGGTSTLVPGMTKHTIASKAAHPSYVANDFDCPNATPDVALVRLTKPVTGVTPLAYAGQGTVLPAAGATLTAVGYGMHHDDGGDVSQELAKRSATETFLDAQPFSLHVGRGTGIVDHGDSGGPLGLGQTILGTASCITTDWPLPYEAYYGRVDAAAPWIDATLTKWKAR
jgi:Trypsin